MKNSIAQRIADFLKDFPPFDRLNPEECYDIASKVEVIYLAKNKTLFNQGDNAHDHFYVVNQGVINLKLKQNNKYILLDVCDAGDILGLRPIFADKTYALQATAKSDTMLYAIPFEEFRPYLNNEAIAQFLLRSFASNQRQPDASEDKGLLISQNLTVKDEKSVNIDYFQQINYTSNPFCVSEDEPIHKVAQQMTNLGISSALIARKNKPVGILTDKDLRRFVATGKVDLKAKAKEIMSHPVLCVEPGMSIAQAQLMLLQHQVGHLCVTKEGESTSEILGILSEHDIVTAQASNPIALLKAIKRAKSAEDLKNTRIQLGHLLEAYLNTELPISHCLELTEGLHKLLFERCAEFSLSEMPTPPPCKFTWLLLGSQARGEQLLMTDQDHALIYEDIEESEIASTKKYFLKLGTVLSNTLETIGFEFCPAEMMASNPEYCLSISEWKGKFQKWIKSPTEKSVLFCNIFFDFKAAFGDLELENELREIVFGFLRNDDKFFAYLASDALKNPPPLGFFKQFIVEDDGAHKDEFDLKARAIMPIVDAARVLALSKEIAGANQTVERFKRLAELEPQNAELYHSCIRSFYDLLKYRSQSGFKHNNSGRFVNLKQLSKHEKNRLKYDLKPIKSLHNNLKTRFNLIYFT